MDAATILKIPMTEASMVFGKSPKSVRDKFKKLAVIWHPDTSDEPRANEVFTYLLRLRDAALNKSPDPVFSQKDRRVFKKENGDEFATTPLSAFSTDTGETLIGRKTVAFLFNPGMEDLASCAVSAWSRIKTADAGMEKAFRPLAPKPGKLDTNLMGGGRIITIERPDGFVSLRDLLSFMGGRMHPYHVAWLGSGLYNLASWFDWMKICHGAINIDSVFLNPETHAVSILGGWEFSTPFDKRPIALPEATLNSIPMLENRDTKADSTVDRLLVREVLRTALGDPAGFKPNAPDLPNEMADAIATPPKQKAADDYADWIKSLEKAWGPRRFKILEVSDKKIYNI